MATQEFSAEQLFATAIDSMRAQVDRLLEKMHEAEQWLGSAVANNPKADHRDLIERVRVARARFEGADEVWQIAFGLKSGQLIPRKVE